MIPKQEQLTPFQKSAISHHIGEEYRTTEQLNKADYRSISPGPEKKAAKDKLKKISEHNAVTAGTHIAHYENTPVSELEEHAKNGHPTPVSGAALDAARRGNRPDFKEL